MSQELQKQEQGTAVSFIIQDTDSIGRLSEMVSGFSLTVKYKTADDWAALKDKEVKAYYMGLQEVPNSEGDAVNCAKFITDSECFISGQLTLVEAVKGLPTETPVSIIYKGKRNNKSSEGSTMIFDVALLK